MGVNESLRADDEAKSAESDLRINFDTTYRSTLFIAPVIWHRSLKSEV